jgi:TonB family protein
MTPIAKDQENTAASSAAGVPVTPAVNPPARPQPVALEVPVTVNGARSVEGSDKREPFSEKTNTVLVFGHGAVIRISAALAPGQLVFLTNERSKKEVVCQVVKSKTDGSSLGYVELRFTEPAPGFWGQRFPSDTVLPQAAPRPAAPAPVPAAPKAPQVAPPPPVVAKPVEPPPAVSSQVHTPPLPVHANISKEPAKATVSFVLPAPPVVESKISAPSPEPTAPVLPTPQAAAGPEIAPTARLAAPPSVPPAVVVLPEFNILPPAVVEAASAEFVPAAVLTPAREPVASPPAVVHEDPKPAVIPAPVSPAASADHSTDELKQQAARLQEQLSALLFAEPPKPSDATSVSAAPVSEIAVAPDLVDKILDLAKQAPAPEPSKPMKSIVPPTKPIPSSLAVEEIKIPSWLAPLARETEAQNSEVKPQQASKSFAEEESAIAEAATSEAEPEAQETPSRPEVAVFGGQLLGESSQSAETSSSGSKSGLFIGIAAALLLVAGGAWYSRQPGNVISGLFGGNSPAAQPAIASSSVPGGSAAKAAAQPAASATSSSRVPARENTPVAAESSVVSKAPLASAPRTSTDAPTHSADTATPVEEPKKPTLGDVRLAAPVVNRGQAPATSSASEPAIDVNQGVPSAAPLSTLGDAGRSGPVAPIAVGGEVKSAKLLRSVPPVYPSMARNQRVTGNVEIDALIDENGSVSTMKVLSGPVLLRDAALESLKHWKYQPAELDGKPTSMHLTVTIQFRAQ